MERGQFKELLKDKEEEIEILAKQSMPNGEFLELNELLNAEKQKTEELQSQLNNGTSAHQSEDISRTEDLKVIDSLKEQVHLKDDTISELKLKIEKIEGELNEKSIFTDKLKVQHENSIKILKQSTQVAVQENNEISERVRELEENLKSSETLATSAQKQIDQLQNKLENFSCVNEENSNLKAEKIQLESDKSKLENQLREVQTRLDNGQNEQLEHSKSWHEDKVRLENECSELKEKIDVLLQDLKTLKEKSNSDELKIGELYQNITSIEKSKNDEIECFKNEKAQLQTDILKLKDEYDTTVKDFQEKLLSKEAECDGKNAEIKSVKETKLTLEKELSDLQEQLKTQDVQKSSENDQIQHWKSQYDQTRDDLNNMKMEHESKVQNLTDNTDTLQQHISDQQSEIKAMEQVIACLKDKNQILENHNESSLNEAEQFKG